MLEKKVDFLKISEGKYDFWIKEKFFSTHEENKPYFSIILPPPNITGKLHLGHALDTIISDVIIRYKKSCGFDTIWIPGMDHAGIATQTKLIDHLEKQKINWRSLGRKKFLEESWKWKEKYANIIRSQWKLLGLSFDYTQEHFTLEEKLNKCVNKVFVNLYNKGLIYRGERIINWDVNLKTALSDIEIYYKKKISNFYYFKYFIDGSNDFLPVATTRPETIFGDVAVVVNPKDNRYKKYIGKYCINPLNNNKIIVIADDYIDINFGTGVMKCTPAHDKNDFEISVRHKLQKINIMNEDGTMNEKTNFCNKLDRFVCREKVINFLKEKKILIKIEKITNKIAYSEKSNTVIEQRLSKQWFVKVKELAKKVIDIQRSEKKIIFFPNRFSKELLKWTKNVNDWCISRQLWWGHQIPVFYKKNSEEIFVSEEPPKEIENYYQDEDVLDTWFSSSLWPFTSLNWPDEKNFYYKRYFPTSLLVTGYDLIFFWIFRMVIQSLEFTKKIPFKECLIHGLIRDEKRRKMSKSLGNGIDPVDVINKYGVDTLRYFFMANSTPGLDISYDEKKIIASFNFLNKIWNSARYVLNIIGNDFIEKEINFKELTIIEKYIIFKLNKTIQKIIKENNKYCFHISLKFLYDFVYDDFCSFFLEVSKIFKNNEMKQVLFYVLKNIILLIYPFTPFIAEELYQNMPHNKKSIMLEKYPEYKKNYSSKNSFSDVLLLRKIIKDIRNYKTTNKIQPNFQIDINIYTNKKLFKGFIECLTRFVFAKKINIFKEEQKNNDNGISFSYVDLSLNIILNVNDDKKKLKKELEELNISIEKSEKLLNNINFLKKATKKKIQEEKNKYLEKTAIREKIIEKIDENK